MLLMYVPCGSLAEAETISKALVLEKLVLCCNLIPNVTSIFRWHGKLRKEKEVLLLAKVLESKQNRAARRVKRLHSYAIPLISFYKTDSVNPAFLSWAKKP